MGSYGIGPTRLVPAIIEGEPRRGRHHLAGVGGAVQVVLINLKAGDAATDAACDRPLWRTRCGGPDVLYDDRDQPAGAKFATADLIGIPYQLIVGPRGLRDGQAEIKHRASGERETLPLATAVARLRGLVEPQRRDKV